MRGTFRLTKIFGINIDIHFTFFLLLLIFFVLLGPRGLLLILGVFFFVTVHELCHSLVALHFGIKVKRITLLPIGGVASMSEIPTKPHQELLISLAGPMSNILIVIIFYYPLYFLLGKETLMYPFMVLTGQAKFSGNFNVLAHIYWINLILAVFNMIPAFPMDGGRVVRALLSYRMGYQEATHIAVRMGHIFALLFGYVAIVHGHIFLLIIAVFIYMAASSEGFQVDVQETIKRYTVQDVLAGEFIHVASEMPLSKILELMFHTHQEDFPVLEDGRLKGMITRREVIQGVHVKGKDIKVGEIMRTDIPTIKVRTRLHDVQKLMQKYNTSAMPVEKNGNIVGVVTMDDINRVFVVAGEPR
ncbi:MAG: site-2 protease family protein [Candidatus Omnitrophota bacterium]